MDIPTLLLSSFIISVTALLFFIWSLRKGPLDADPAAAKVIFSSGEIGHVDEPAVDSGAASRLQQAIPVSAVRTSPDPEELRARLVADRSTAMPAFAPNGRRCWHTRCAGRGRAASGSA